MSLQLIIDNTKTKQTRDSRKERPTCKTGCSLFDPFTNKCGYYPSADIESPNVYARCLRKCPIEDDVEMDIYYEDSIQDDEETFYEFAGHAFDEEQSTYPFKPDIDSPRDDATWYIDPTKTYGCWIVNQSERKLVGVTNKGVEVGWSKHVYKSPYPVHNHKSALSLASKMCWYVSSDGFGQYVLLSQKGEIKMISAPRPQNWVKGH
ncbi:hypothetical protein ACFSCX_06280 [Bacillus salitolerans]|uniref:Uncharacterized protein n=1 Tax=Bacillus salitolerans TaxID=1437434 RepID=A0ABW4LLW6_9BACI